MIKIERSNYTHNRHLVDEYKFGFVTNYSGTQQTTIAFDDSTYTFTLAPTGSDWEYYRNGVKYTIAGNKTVVIDSPTSPPTKGFYYIVIDATDGTLTASTTSWTLEDTQVPVATVAWDNALTPKYWLADERHTCAIPRRYHFEHHFADGTEIISAPTLAGYTVTPFSPTDADNTFSIGESIIVDEDLKLTLAALADPDGATAAYNNFYPTGGLWYWVESDVPFSYSPDSYIYYNKAGTPTVGQNNKYYNTYLVLTDISGDARHSIVWGEGEFSTLLAAKGENFSKLDLSGIQINEFVAVYQLVWESSASFSTKGKVRLATAPIAIEVTSIGGSAAVSQDHSQLTNLEWSTSGHTIDTDFDANSNKVISLADGDADGDAIAVGQTVSDAQLKYTRSYGSLNEIDLYNLIDYIPRIDIREAGALGDVQLINGDNAAITATDNTLTVTTGIFASGDVGKIIQIEGAGTAGALHQTTIASFTSSTEVEITLAAITTVTDANVRFATDDTLAIQAAIDALQDTGYGGVVYIPNGEFWITAELDITSNDIKVIGEGGGWGRDTFTPLYKLNEHNVSSTLRWVGADDDGSAMIHIRTVKAATAAETQKISGCMIEGVGFYCQNYTNADSSQYASHGIQITSLVAGTFRYLFIDRPAESGINATLIDTTGVVAAMDNQYNFFDAINVAVRGTAKGFHVENNLTPMVGNFSKNHIKNFYVQFENGAAFSIESSDHNTWDNIGGYRIAGGTGNGLELHGASVSSDRSRFELFLRVGFGSADAFGSGPTVKVFGTDTYTVASTGHKILYFDLNQGTANPILETGATLEWHGDDLDKNLSGDIYFPLGKKIFMNSLRFLHQGSSTNSTYIGPSSGKGASTALNNAGVGSAALGSITTGINNASLGASSGILITTGDRNMSVGTNSNGTIVGGDDNVSIGNATKAGGSSGDNSRTTNIGNLSANQSSADDTVNLGYQAGYYNNTNYSGYIHVGLTGTDGVTPITNEATAQANSLVYMEFDGGGLFSVNGDHEANTYFGAGTGLTGTAASLTVGNATSATNATNATNVSTSQATSGTRYIAMFDAASASNQIPKYDADINYNPLTNVFTVPKTSTQLTNTILYAELSANQTDTGTAGTWYIVQLDTETDADTGYALDTVTNVGRFTLPAGRHKISYVQTLKDQGGGGVGIFQMRLVQDPAGTPTYPKYSYASVDVASGGQIPMVIEAIVTLASSTDFDIEVGRLTGSTATIRTIAGTVSLIVESI